MSEQQDVDDNGMTADDRKRHGRNRGKILSSWGDNLGDNTSFEFREVRSRLLRKWYIRGQASFRGGVKMPEGLNETQQEGWNMGWASDLFDEQHGLQESSLGTDNSGDEQTYLSQL